MELEYSEQGSDGIHSKKRTAAGKVAITTLFVPEPTPDPFGSDPMLPEEPSIKLSIMDPSGKSHVLSFQPGETIASLHGALEAKAGLPSRLTLLLPYMDA